MMNKHINTTTTNITNIIMLSDKLTAAEAKERAKERLTEVVENIFANSPNIDRMLAIGAGHRALERGEAFFDAVEIAEGVLNLWREVVHNTREALIARRNVERLTEYRIKRAGFFLFKKAVARLKAPMSSQAGRS